MIVINRWVCYKSTLNTVVVVVVQYNNDITRKIVRVLS